MHFQTFAGGFLAVVSVGALRHCFRFNNHSVIWMIQSESKNTCILSVLVNADISYH